MKRSSKNSSACFASTFTRARSAGSNASVTSTLALPRYLA